SGIPEWVSDEVHARVIADPRHVWTAEEAIEVAMREPPAFPPGTQWQYSNTNYTLIGMALDRVQGKPWRVQVRERIFDRLGLANTRLPEPGDTNLPADHAHGYHEVAGMAIDVSGVDPSMAGAAGGNALVTTAADLGRFLRTLLSGGLFSKPETLAAMTTMMDAPHESGLPHRYGLGLESFTLPGGQTVIGHGGSAAGYAVMMFQVPANGATLVTAINTSNLFANALEVFIPALAVVAQEP
ncbi:MAG TPA: serine hydrolase domain-containing protein, partial [Polyangia bacterium]